MVELAEEVLQLPVRLGQPRGVGGLVDVVKSPVYATGVGLVLYGAKQQENALRSPLSRSESKSNGSLIGRLGEIFRQWF